MSTPVSTYLNAIKQNLAAANATEHTHRPALQQLIQSLAKGIQATNEPKHRTDCGAPDFVVMRTKGHLPIGHIEAKDTHVSLTETHKSEQLERYRKYLPNLILTNYIDFRWYVNGEDWGQASLGSLDSAGKLKTSAPQQQQVEKLLTDFLAQTPQPINSAKALAERLARLTHMTRDIVVEAFQRHKATPTLKDLRQVLAQTLIPDLLKDDQVPQFADLYAQTLTYGLFAAKCHHAQHGGGTFDLNEAASEIPKTNPLLRQLFNNITGPDFNDEPYAGFVRELVAVLDNTDIDKVLEDFGRAGVLKDPVLHFYETFLATYDPALRESRGVYYTPEPVVGYIVRSVDQLLKSRFKIKDGLADTQQIDYKPNDRTPHPDIGLPKSHRTLILDPAAGTGTFLYEVVEQIRESFRKNNKSGLWSNYVHEHLLPRIFGFELLMAPYAMAHLKLGMQLAAQDLPPSERTLLEYGFETDDRLQVYLTNTLEQVETHAQQMIGSLGRAVSDEAAQAARVKRELPILVVLGNPPYSGISSNSGAWIDGLLKGAIPSKNPQTGKTETTPTASYYHVDGKPLGERNPKWLQDDYVKFIRWAQWRLEQTGHGVLAFITNHGYLDNPTFRGMRWSLMHAFDEIYVLDLHGNTKKKETAPDGSVDQNVFDIQQGVAIGIFVKTGDKKREGKPATIHHAELWGKRDGKYEWLAGHGIDKTDWKKVEPEEPFYLFKPIDKSVMGDYSKWPSITDIMQVNSVGIVTGRDGFVIDFERVQIERRIDDFAVGNASDDAMRERYLSKKDKLDIAKAREALKIESDRRRAINPLLYRPFDTRWICYHEAIIERSRREAMPQMLARENLAIVTARSNKFPDPNHFFASKSIVETKCGEASTQSATFPLYLYPGVGKADQSSMFQHWPKGKDGRRPNLDPGFVQDIENATDLEFISDGRGDLAGDFGPEDVAAYIYAVFHWPEYRRRYEPMLKIDFPRVPPPEDAERFTTFAKLGHQLLAAHLLEDETIAGDTIGYPANGDNRVEKGYPKYVPPASEPIKVGKVKLEPDEEHGRVYISPDQYFEGIEPAVWEFQIGGYQVCDKWLKDRRGRVLDYDDLTHYPKIVESLRKTIDLMQQIEEAAKP
jgi:hypothetical protein